MDITTLDRIYNFLVISFCYHCDHVPYLYVKLAIVFNNIYPNLTFSQVVYMFPIFQTYVITNNTHINMFNATDLHYTTHSYIIIYHQQMQNDALNIVFYYYYYYVILNTSFQPTVTHMYVYIYIHMIIYASTVECQCLCSTSINIFSKRILSYNNQFY